MSLRLLERTSPQEGETINLNLSSELTIVIFFKLTTFHICRPSVFKHLSKNNSILDINIWTLVNSKKISKFYMLFKTCDIGVSSFWNGLKLRDYKRNLIMECAILPLLNVNVLWSTFGALSKLLVGSHVASEMGYPFHKTIYWSFRRLLRESRMVSTTYSSPVAKATGGGGSMLLLGIEGRW